MKNKIMKFALFTLIILFSSSCSSIKQVLKPGIKSYLLNDFSSWSKDDCISIIQYYALTNNETSILTIAEKKPQIVINALPLNKNVILALVKKEAIEKRYNNDEYKNRLKDYLESYTSFTLDTVNMKIIESDSNFYSGYSFKLYLENKTDPFSPIFLEDGYSYFFLENMQGKFSRIIEVTGLYAEDDIQLDGYLNVVVTFSPFATDGTRLFNNKDLIESYRLVFNGLQRKPIVLEWKKLD